MTDASDPSGPAALGWPPDAPLLDAIASAVIATDLDGRIFYWNAAAEQLYGYGRDQMLGANVAELLVGLDDRDAGAQIMERVLAGETWSGEFQVRTAGGGTRAVRITDSPLINDGAVVGVIGVAEDLTDGRVARRDADLLATRLTRLALVTAELTAADTVEEVTDIVVAQAADAVGADVASMVLLEGDVLRLIGVRGVNQKVQNRWSQFPADTRVPIAAAATTGQRIVVTGRDNLLAAYPDVELEPDEERSSVALPLVVEGSHLGAISLGFRFLREFDAQELEFLGTLADSCAHALQRLEATEAARRTAAKLTFLAMASSELASSLDYEVTLANVARLAVPTLADWCAVQVLQDGQLRALAVAHVDPAKVELARELQERYPADMDAQNGAPNVLRTGVSELIAEITDEMLVAGTKDEEHLRIARELNLRSALFVPLRANGRTIGTIALVYAESGRRYDASDVEFAEDLAHRAAMAIDNSELHTQTREASLRLQRAVLPDKLPSVEGWELAAHYSPADRTEVGGDFYDALPLPDGRLALVVGDVMGRGVQAASQMAAIRSAIRAFISLDPDPALVVTNLDRMFAAFDISQFVTLAYLVVDTDRDEIAMVNAGHLPPLIVTAAGHVYPADVTTTLPLGVSSDTRAVDVVPLPPGAAVAVFTDGLVERRREDIDVGVARLVEHLRTSPGKPLEDAVGELVRAMHDEVRQDDVTLLVARRTA
jgi:PAS domain S-box-containing protein